MTADIIEREHVLAQAAEIVSAYVGNNAVAHAEVPALLHAIFSTLSALASNSVETASELTPAVPIRKSVTDDYLICLEDGKKLKMLKRHLMTAYGMTPNDYRAKWGLAWDYPMVAAGYSARRSELAIEVGLGRRRKESDSPAPASTLTDRKPATRAGAKRKVARPS